MKPIIRFRDGTVSIPYSGSGPNVTVWGLDGKPHKIRRSISISFAENGKPTRVETSTHVYVRVKT